MGVPVERMMCSTVRMWIDIRNSFIASLNVSRGSDGIGQLNLESKESTKQATI